MTKNQSFLLLVLNICSSLLKGFLSQKDISVFLISLTFFSWKPYSFPHARGLSKLDLTRHCHGSWERERERKEEVKILPHTFQSPPPFPSLIPILSEIQIGYGASSSLILNSWEREGASLKIGVFSLLIPISPCGIWKKTAFGCFPLSPQIWPFKGEGRKIPPFFPFVKSLSFSSPSQFRFLLVKIS